MNKLLDEKKIISNLAVMLWQGGVLVLVAVLDFSILAFWSLERQKLASG